MTRRLRHAGRQEGFSAVEMMFTLGILAILSSMAIVQINASRPGLKGDGALRVVLGQMNQARELAISQRRYMRIVFTTPNRVAVVREDTTTTTTTLSTTIIEGGVAYATISGVGDTPDAFATGCTGAICFGTAVNMKFTPDGTLVNENGQSLNGTVFLSWSNQKTSARAITVLGSTGRIRGYRWDGRAWKLV